MERGILGSHVPAAGAALHPLPPRFLAPSDTLLSAASYALCLQPDVYSLALSLAQAGAAAPAAAGGCKLAEAALHLLGVLPTCPAARAQLRGLLLAPDGGHKLSSLLQQQGAAQAAQPAVLMYAAQCLCALVFPQQGLAGEGAGAAVEASAAGADLEALQRRLVLSGVLEALLDLACRQAAPQGPAAAAADPAVEAATHGAVLLLLHNMHAGLQAQQAAAAAAARQPEEAAAAVAAAAAGAAQGKSASAMQVDSASPGVEATAEGATNGGSAEVAAEVAVPASGLRVERSVSVSMAAAGSADASDADAAALPVPVGTAQQELEAASAALAALAPAIARYILRMLCCMLRCHPGGAASRAQQGQQAALLPAAATASGVSLTELCSQALQLLKQLAQQSSAAVEVVTVADAAAAEAVVRRLLLHPASTQPLRHLAAEWLPGFAAAAPVAHRWAFERLVQPLLLAGGEGGDEGSGSSQEQMALCNHFIETLDYAEARRILLFLIDSSIDRCYLWFEFV